jgi:hypothetical protein
MYQLKLILFKLMIVQDRQDQAAASICNLTVTFQLQQALTKLLSIGKKIRHKRKKEQESLRARISKSKNVTINV